jgi:predicted RNase H-like HicB family nuclease
MHPASRDWRRPRSRGTALVFEGGFGYFHSMKFRLVVEFDAQTKRWSAVFPELPGCASAGDTEEEAIRNAKEALKLWFEPSDVKLGKKAKLVEVSLP